MIPTSPPSYQMSVEEFDRKTSQAIQNAPEVDEDGWEIYDPEAFESAAENHERSPPSSSSARILGADTSRHAREGRRLSGKASGKAPGKALPPTPLKIRNERDSQPEDEHRVASPPPPFTPTAPSLDGPPFDEAAAPSYPGGSDSTAAPILEPYPPSPRSPSPPRRALPSVEPLRLSSNRPPNSQLRASPNPYPSHRQISPISNPTSTIARVDFDPQSAYSPYSGSVGNHTHIRANALAFYNHAVASQLTASSAVTAQTQPHMERVSSPHTGGYTPTPWAQQATPSASFHEQYAPHMHSGVSAVPPPPPPLQTYTTSTGVGHGYSSPSGTIPSPGPLPPAPPPSSQLRWAGSESQIVQDVYGGQYGGHG